MLQDHKGFLWFATDSNLWRYDGYNLKSYSEIFNFDKKDRLEINEISKLLLSNNGDLWVASKTNGLFKIVGNSIKPYQKKPSNNKQLSLNRITTIYSMNDNMLWIGTNNGLKSLSRNKESKHYLFNDIMQSNKENYITSINTLSIHKLLIGTMNGLYSFDDTSHKFNRIKLTKKNSQIIIYSIVKDKENNLWLGTDQGVYLKNQSEKLFVKYMPDIFNFPILSILVTDKNLWFGSILEGLIKVSKEDDQAVFFKHANEVNSSISGNSITSLMLDSSGLLWITNFNGGVNYIDTKALNFNLEAATSTSFYCSENSIVYDINVYQNDVWLATEKRVVKYNPRKKECIPYNHNINKYNLITQEIPLSIRIGRKKQIWLSTSKGLHKIDGNNVSKQYQFSPNRVVFFSHEFKEGVFLLGTDHGLFFFEVNKDIITHVDEANVKLHSAKFYNFEKSRNNKYYFATNVGVASFDNNEKLIIIDKIQSFLPTKEITSILIKNKELWIGTHLNGLYHFNQKYELIKKHNALQGVFIDLSIQSILSDEYNNLWMGTNNGLVRFNIKNEASHIFNMSDGLQGDYFLRSSSYKALDGKLYFGGRNGFNAFYPKNIKFNETPPNIVLTDFTRFGQSIEVGIEKDGFMLKKNINQLNELTLSHRDYVVGFEFAALDFADSSRNKYAYKMEGLDPDWIYTDASNRRISYSNLSSGKYIFRVKGSNKDGIWNEQGKFLKIIVKPAPWFSWWAYSIYLIVAYCLISWFFKRKNAENQKLTEILKVEVSRQTKELKVQKQSVEDLLAKKNELFANISHEFRTPLTLILGPTNKLLKSNLHHSDISALKMVNRNANRLLTMIEQLLVLAKTAGNTEIEFNKIKTRPVIAKIIDSFVSLANKKDIDLTIKNNDEAAINVSQDALDIIVGNLLSNAVKYTQQAGMINVNSSLQNNKLSIAVTDTGCGLDEQQQHDIFNRFKRLDSHQNIEGIGIGLSVVEDLLKINNASIDIKSKPGEGSTFTVIFNAIELDFEDSAEKIDTLLLKQLTSEVLETKQDTSYQHSANKHNTSILIIEDNHDMRAHIAQTLEDNYHCLLAGGGKAGIALAIKHVPDIVICDVMMPDMDGFHVSRVLRSDTRTSHIPLMLLTALDDRESRIRGWREHVDVYLTKPFDAQELLLQLENILVIRNIIKQKAGKKIKAGQSSNNSDLPKRDQQFINKLNVCINKKYRNPNYLRPQMASDMAVSERQLQRKLKALIDRNPMGLLREYRLSQAAIMLKDGYQVSIASDECGFNSLPHFSKCFKSQYGLSPKVYQTNCK